MAMHALAEIEKLQADLLRMQVTARRSAGILTLQGAEPAPSPTDMVAVGYSLESNGSYSVQLRVPTDEGELYNQALALGNVAEQNGVESNLVVIQEARVPTAGEVDASEPIPEMIDRSRLHLGVSVGHPDGKPGSLGAFVNVRGRLGIISASHVLSVGPGSMGGRVAPESMIIHHPGSGDALALGPKTEIGVLEDYTVLARNNINRIDAAIALLLPERAAISQPNMIPHDLGPSHLKGGKKLTTVTDSKLVRRGSRVGKFGRTTGYTEGTVSGVGLTPVAITTDVVANTKVAYDNMMEITWDDPINDPFSLPGDSGAVLFTLEPLEAVGIHVAGGKTHDGTAVSYACSLAVALVHFGCTLA